MKCGVYIGELGFCLTVSLDTKSSSIPLAVDLEGPVKRDPPSSDAHVSKRRHPWYNLQRERGFYPNHIEGL